MNSWSLLPRAPAQLKVRSHRVKGLGEVSSFFIPWKSKGQCFVGSKKTEPEEKCLKTIHLVHNASPSVERSVHSQEGNGASSPGWEMSRIRNHSRPPRWFDVSWTHCILHQNVICLTQTFLWRCSLQPRASFLYVSVNFYTQGFGGRDTKSCWALLPWECRTNQTSQQIGSFS